jgi:hypothetical protein
VGLVWASSMTMGLHHGQKVCQSPLELTRLVPGGIDPGREAGTMSCSLFVCLHLTYLPSTLLEDGLVLIIGDQASFPTDPLAVIQ